MSEKTWEKQHQGVITGDYIQDLALIRRLSHAETSEDVKIHEFTLLDHPAAVIYIDGMANDAKVQEFLLTPCLTAAPLPAGEEMESYLDFEVPVLNKEVSKYVVLVIGGYPAVSLMVVAVDLLLSGA